jgi:hypothetical protein
MCHLQRQQQQQQQQQVQQQQYPAAGFHQQAYDSRRPLQEKHQNREELVATATANPSSNMAVSHLKSSSSMATMKSDQLSSNLGVVSVSSQRMPNVNRTLSVDPKKDYSAPLHVDCSVEYDLPRIVRPPPGAEPLLVFAPPRSSTVATPSGYHPSTWTTTTTNSRPLPPQWNQQQQGAASRIKSDKPSAASVKSHPAAIQQQQQQKLNSTSKSSNI